MSLKTMDILKNCIPIFTMLSDENRQEILLLLFDNKVMTVNEISEKMMISRPTVSHHLKLLLQNKLVTVQKKGKERYYLLELENSIQLLKQLIESIETDEKNLRNK